jgi:hypothetical protein
MQKSRIMTVTACAAIVACCMPVFAVSIDYVPTNVKAIYVRFPDSSPPKSNESRVVDVRAEKGMIRFQCAFSATKELTVKVQYVNDAYLSVNKNATSLDKKVLAGGLRFTFNWTRGKDGTGDLRLTSWDADPSAPIDAPLREKLLLPKKEPMEFRLVTLQEEKKLPTYDILLESSWKIQSWRGEEAAYTLTGTRGEKVHILLAAY